MLSHLRFPCWTERHSIHRSEMSLDRAQKLLIHEMEKIDFEMSDFGRCVGHVHRFLTSTHDDMVHERRDGCRVERTIGLERFHHFQRARIEDLATASHASAHIQQDIRISHVPHAHSHPVHVTSPSPSPLPLPLPISSLTFAE